jgi:hypothetical protein
VHGQNDQYGGVEFPGDLRCGRLRLRAASPRRFTEVAAGLSMTSLSVLVILTRAFVVAMPRSVLISKIGCRESEA